LHQLQLLGRGPDGGADLVIEEHQPGGIALTDQQRRQGGHGGGGMVVLGGASAARIAHRCAGVQEERRLEIALLLEPLDVVAVAARIHAPVELLEIIAGAVLAVVGEFDAQAVQRASVLA
jgi:hypothetical protein